MLPEPTRATSTIAAPPPALPRTPPAPRPDRPAQQDGGYKDTIESILVAFILAFVFRAFVVEAFVIPTGSMAPTLLGAHLRMRCEECGYPFTVNFSGKTVGDDVEIPSQVKPVFGEPKVLGMTCPNCAYQVPPKLPDERHPQASARNDATAPPVFYGDRILVLKYLWLLEDPRRWEVVVFKSPDDQSGGQGRFSMNYIKRLVGRPGETIVVLDGDVYVGPPGADPFRNADEFKVQSKPRVVQNALWRVVYDNDYLPRRPDWAQPWAVEEGGSGWTLTDDAGAPSRTFRFAGGSDADPGRFSAIAFDAEANAGKHSFTEWLAYDATMWQFEQSRRQSDRRPPADTSDLGDDRYHFRPQNNVSDAKVDFYYQRTAGDGPLRVQLTKLGHAFTAELSAGRVALHHRKPGAGGGADDALGDEVAAAADVPGALAGSAPVRVEFMNVDYEVSLWINETLVLRHRYDPDVKALLDAYSNKRMLDKPQVRIAAAGHDCALSHVSLWRDIYYTNRHNDGSSELEAATPNEPLELLTAAPELPSAARVSHPGGYATSTDEIRFTGLAADANLRPGRFVRLHLPGMESASHEVVSVRLDAPGDDPRAAGSGSIRVRSRDRVQGPIPDGTPITILPCENEYFVMGDNSLISGDARYWDKPILIPDEDLYVAASRVPERFMLGKAFFVYWPAGYRPADTGPWGVVPNFGEMRFIH